MRVAVPVDQQLAGGILWSSGDAIGLLFFAVLFGVALVFIRWFEYGSLNARWDDNAYGLISWKMDLEIGRNVDTRFGNPDFVAMAQSFGAIGYRVDGPSELEPVLNAAFSCGKPAVIDCPVDYSENLRLSEQLKALGTT